MSTQSIQQSYPIFTDIDGSPLESGNIYIGTAGLPAATNQITVYWDAALTTPATQPIRTTGGYPMNAGTPGNIYTGVDDYSIAVNNKNNSAVTSALNVYSPFNSSSLSYNQGFTGAVTRSVESKLKKGSVNVWDFIPEGTDTAAVDCSPYFNLATQATVAYPDPFTGDLAYEIVVPNGRYRIDSTVYVRKGQSLTGGGKNVILDFTNCNDEVMILMGTGLISGVPTVDASGIPCTVHNFFTLGGPASNAVISADIAGYTISNMFMTSAATAIYAGGGDGILNNIEIDIAANGIIISCDNCVITNFNLYQCNFAFSINEACYDVQISNGTVQYTLYAGMIFDAATGSNEGFNVSNVNFLQNAAYAGTWLGCIVVKKDTKARFNHCQFSNYHSYAVSCLAGIAYLDFTGCLFSGLRTNPAYAQNTSSAGLLTLLGGFYTFEGCDFRNMYGPCWYVVDGIGNLNVEGGSILVAPQDRLVIDAGVASVPTISISDVTGLPNESSSATDQFIVLPYWTGTTTWEVSARGNTQVSASGLYSRFEKSVFTINSCYDGANTIMDVTKDIVAKSATQSNPPDLALAHCVGTAPGGAAFGVGTATSGFICISFAAVLANTNHVKWSANLLS